MSCILKWNCSSSVIALQPLLACSKIKEQFNILRNTFINFLAELDEKVVTTECTLNMKLELAAGIVADLLISLLARMQIRE